MSVLPPIVEALASRALRESVRDHDTRVAWRRFGDGPPLVLLHGGHGCWLHWVRNIDALSGAGRSVWVPDMPGFGDSDALPGDASAPDRLERLVAVLDRCLDTLLGAGTSIDVAGFSFGGLVAAGLAGQRTGVRRLALLGPAGHRTPRRPRAALQEWRLPFRPAMLAALRHNLEAHMIADPQQVNEVAMAVHEVACLRTRFRSKELSLSRSLTGAMGSVELPVLTIFGEHDVTATPVDAIASLMQLGPRGQCVIEPGAGHWVQFEQAAQVNRRLTAWFR